MHLLNPLCPREQLIHYDQEKILNIDIVVPQFILIHYIQLIAFNSEFYFIASSLGSQMDREQWWLGAKSDNMWSTHWPVGEEAVISKV